ncbi:MAG: hypothetical protein ACRDX8_12145 [Acidimicrobiales bacterium]
MLSRILACIATPADIRSAAAIACSVLATVLGPHGAMFVPVVDGVAGLVVALDVALGHKRNTDPTAIPASPPPRRVG